MEGKITHLNWGGLYGTLCRVIQYSLLSNPCCKAWLNIQKSVQVIVPKKSMKVDGGKDLTVGIRQTLFIRYLKIAVARKRLLI